MPTALTPPARMARMARVARAATGAPGTRGTRTCGISGPSGSAHPPPGRLSGPRYRGLAVGLLGGSFNPAHDGHLDLSRAALARLGLDRVWWLVSPLNPLKSGAEMAPLADRLAGARALARHPAIQVTALEAELGTRRSLDSLHALRRHFPATRFVWLMGADSLAELPRWYRWRQFFESIPIAVAPRPPYSISGLSGLAAGAYRRYQMGAARGRGLARQTPPAWVVLPMPENPISATAIRALGRGARAEAAARRHMPGIDSAKARDGSHRESKHA